MKGYDIVTEKRNTEYVQSNFFPKICWVIALRAEATPFIEALNLKALNKKTYFPIYLNQEIGHALVISGVGSVKSGAAAAYMKAQLDVENHAAWINVGVSGYFKDSIGELFQAIKVVAQNSQKIFFPGLKLSRILKNATLK